MSNKEIFKYVFDQQFNNKAMKQQILIKKENSSINKIHYIKWIMVPICLLIVCSFLYNDIKIPEKTIKPTEVISSNKEDTISIYINKIKHIGASKWDAKVQDVTKTNILSHFKELSHLSIPDDLNHTQYYEVYIKSIDSTNTNTISVPKDPKIPYNKLFQYEICYQNPNNERSIVIAFSKDNIPWRDYHFSDEGSKVSIIHDVELTIYQYENLLLCNFTYQNINFDIETCGISEAELIALLTSMIQS